MADSDGHISFFAITAAIGAVAGAIVGGIVAAKNGGNVLAGIGIGAFAGGLIGLGAGAAASAMLAGNVLATTAEVVAGGAGLASTVSAGGLGAGATYIADNVVNALNHSAPVLQENVNNVYYQITSKAGATQIADSNILKPVESAFNYVLNFQPTLEQAQQTGARAVETVIQFSTTYTGFIKDATCAINGALVAILPERLRYLM